MEQSPPVEPMAGGLSASVVNKWEEVGTPEDGREGLYRRAVVGFGTSDQAVLSQLSLHSISRKNVVVSNNSPQKGKARESRLMVKSVLMPTYAKHARLTAVPQIAPHVVTSK